MEDDGKRKAKILVVDDHQPSVRRLAILLRAKGYEVLEGYSGAEALEKAQKELPDLILLDVMMSNMDGYEVCDRLRQTEQMKAVPIVMITALHGLDNKIKALNIGADDFISKPFSNIEVMARVRSSLRVKHLHDELAAANQKLEEQNQLLEDELTMAREVQEALLPKEIEAKRLMPPELEFCSQYRPALAVGGDFFDIAKIAPNVIGIFIADVMGHGAQPALITVLIKTLLSELFYESPTPAELLAELNRRYNELVRQTGIYTSAFYLIVDISQQKVIFSNAGHPPALLIRKEKPELKELVKESGLALGLASDYDYQNHEEKLESEDTILLYTDGLSDISNRNGEVFGFESLKAVVANNLKLQNATLIQTILDAIDKFTGNAPEDDITVLTIGFSNQGFTHLLHHRR